MRKYLGTLTSREKSLSTTKLHVRDLPCLVENTYDEDESKKVPCVCTTDDDADCLRHDAQYSKDIEHELASDSTEEIQMKSCLRFVSLPSLNNKEYQIKMKSDKLEWKKYQTYHVPTMPPILWKSLVHILGIPVHPGKKPYLATILYTLTCASVFVYVVSSSWYIGYDIANVNTERKALKGTVEILFRLLWGLLVIYANKLSYRMFTHQGFVKYIKMHSKTILKCKTGYLIIIFGLLFTILYNYYGIEDFYYDKCEIVKLSNFMCPLIGISRIFFSAFGILWNIIVALVILSVCRTHCLQIRQFIRELEKDALAHDEYRRRAHSTSTMLTNMSNMKFDLPEDPIEMDDDIESHSSSDENEVENSNLDGKHRSLSIYVVPHSSDNAKTGEETLQGSRWNGNSSDHRHNEQILQPADILHQYWKLQCSLRLSSSAFKRWTVCFMSICVIWLGSWLVCWLSETPAVLEVFLLLIPLLWFAIICSAIAEVNNEGQRIMRYLCPSEERIRMLIYLNNAPLQMALYGFSIKYSNLVTGIIGLAFALMSGIVLQEIKSL